MNTRFIEKLEEYRNNGKQFKTFYGSEIVDAKVKAITDGYAMLEVIHKNEEIHVHCDYSQVVILVKKE